MDRIVLGLLLLLINLNYALANPVECRGLFEQQAGETPRELKDPRQFVTKIARQFYDRLQHNRAIEFEDLVQSGLEGVLEAEQRWKPGLQNKSFAAYAYSYAFYKMLEQLSPGSSIGPSRTLYIEIENKKREFFEKYKRAATPEEMAREMGKTPDEYLTMVAQITETMAATRHQSLYTTVTKGKSSGEELDLLDVIVDPNQVPLDVELSLKRGEEARTKKTQHAILNGVMSERLSEEVASNLYRLDKDQAKAFMYLDVQAMSIADYEARFGSYVDKNFYNSVADVVTVAEKKIAELIKDPSLKLEFESFANRQRIVRETTRDSGTDPQIGKLGPESEKENFRLGIKKLMTAGEISKELGAGMLGLEETLLSRVDLSTFDGFFVNFVPSLRLARNLGLKHEDKIYQAQGKVVLKIQEKLNPKLWKEFEAFVKQKNLEWHTKLGISHKGTIPERQLLITELDQIPTDKLSNLTRLEVKRQLVNLSNDDVITLYYHFLKKVSAEELKKNIDAYDPRSPDALEKILRLAVLHKLRQNMASQEYKNLIAFLQIHQSLAARPMTESDGRIELKAEILASWKLSEGTKEILLPFLSELDDLKVQIFLDAIFKNMTDRQIEQDLVFLGISKSSPHLLSKTIIPLKKFMIRSVNDLLTKKSPSAAAEFTTLLGEMRQSEDNLPGVSPKKELGLSHKNFQVAISENKHLSSDTKSLLLQFSKDNLTRTQAQVFADVFFRRLSHKEMAQVLTNLGLASNHSQADLVDAVIVIKREALRKAHAYLANKSQPASAEFKSYLEKEVPRDQDIYKDKAVVGNNKILSDHKARLKSVILANINLSEETKSLLIEFLSSKISEKHAQIFVDSTLKNMTAEQIEQDLVNLGLSANESPEELHATVMWSKSRMYRKVSEFLSKESPKAEAELRSASESDAHRELRKGIQTHPGFSPETKTLLIQFLNDPEINVSDVHARIIKNIVVKNMTNKEIIEDLKNSGIEADFTKAYNLMRTARTRPLRKISEFLAAKSPKASGEFEILLRKTNGVTEGRTKKIAESGARQELIDAIAGSPNLNSHTSSLLVEFLKVELSEGQVVVLRDIIVRRMRYAQMVRQVIKSGVETDSKKAENLVNMARNRGLKKINEFLATKSDTAVAEFEKLIEVPSEREAIATKVVSESDREKAMIALDEARTKLKTAILASLDLSRETKDLLLEYLDESRLSNIHAYIIEKRIFKQMKNMQIELILVKSGIEPDPKRAESLVMTAKSRGIRKMAEFLASKSANAAKEFEKLIRRKD